MRTWYGYDSNGCLRSIESHHHGWPAHIDFNSVTPPESIAAIISQRRANGVVGFFLHDCECASDDTSCVCHNSIVSDNYVEGGVLLPKPATFMKVNGVAQQHRALVPAGETFTVQVEGPVPDGAEVEVVFALSGSQPSSTKTTFTDGATPLLTFTIPRPTYASIGFWGKYVKHIGVTLVRQ